MKTGPAVSLVLFAVAFQALASPLYRAGNLLPDFPFLALAYLGFFAPRWRLLLLASLTALGIDLLSLDPLGTRLVGYIPALWLLNLARRGFMAESVVLRGLLVLAASALAFELGGAFVLLREGSWLGAWTEFLGAGYTALIGIGAHAALDRYRGHLGWSRDRFFAIGR